MKYLSQPHQRFNPGFFLILFLVLFVTQLSWAQSSGSMEQGVVRIKVSESLAAQLESARMTRSANNVLLTGISSLDNVGQQFKVSGIKRVFRPAGKYEEKHRRYGLHLWYEIQIDKAASVLNAIGAYQAIPQVQRSEPIYKKMIIGSDNKNFGPVVYHGDLRHERGITLPGASNDPMFAQQWHYNNTGQTGGTVGSDISLIEAWGLETGNSNVIVAVTDGGIQVNHPDIAANMWVNIDEVPGNNVDDDGNGYVDDINGYGFGDNTGTIPADAHGTHVGGTIAAVTNNGVGVAGVAGGTGTGDGVRLMSCAAFGASGTGGFEDTYTYGADNGAVISQNSWGYTVPGAFEQAVLDAIDYFIAEAGTDNLGNQVGPMKGGIVIFAAGNSNTNQQHYPGFYAPTLAVAGTTHQDKKAWYSNFGPWVDIAAPGGETNSVAQQGVLSTLNNNQYGFFQGTSMACPHTSGVAALIVSKFGGNGFTPAMLRGRLVETTDNIDAVNPTFIGMLGSGRLNAFAALQQDDNNPPEAIDDLAVASIGITNVSLEWTSPADSGNSAATSYDIRYSTSPIDTGNFNAATQVPNPPAPGPAGTTSTANVTGLLPGTLYYFAVKSADFFGNVSDISNVVSATTNFAPDIEVSPTSLTANLQTAGSTSLPLWIVNNGEGPLNFSFVASSGFATPSPGGGTVAAHDSTEVSVTFDATGLLAGTYNQNLAIESNDPFDSLLAVPLTLHVTNNGAPIASVSPDSVNFGGIFIGGSTTRNVTVHNAGSETLTIDHVSSNNPDFASDFVDTVSVAPFSNATIMLTYTASALGISSGTITIYTNDLVNSTLHVSLVGEGLDAPAIVVTPDSLYQSLNTDHTATQTLTVSNPGDSNLEFAVSVSTGVQAVATVKTIDIPAQSTSPATAEEKRTVANATSAVQQVRIKSVGKSAAVTTVLILSPDNNVSDMEVILDGFEDVQADIFPKASLPGITLSALTPYDIVFTTNNTQWQASGGISPVTIGNLLADYIDQGGKVIVNQFAYSYDAWKMEGRFITENYGPFTPSTTDANISVDLGTIHAPGHPIMEGVSTLSYSGFVQDVGLTAGATSLASWDNGELFLAANANVVGLNMLPSLGNGGPLQWTGDLPTIYQNAIHYLSGPSFIEVNPLEGIVAPDAQMDLEVTFDATGLAGGLYPASIDISSNVPGNELVSVPALLNVLGPEFTVTPDSLYQELEKDQTATQTLLLSNNGTGDFTFEVSVQDKGVSSVSVKKVSAAPAKVDEAARKAKLDQSAARLRIDLNGTQSLAGPADASARRSPLSQLAVEQYGTDFESFSAGDVNGQQGWAGQFGNWTIGSSNPHGGSKHFRGLADGLGLSLAFSPGVSVGAEDKSTTSMKVDLIGKDVTWQVIPQSPSAGFVNTRIQFAPDGSAQALVSNGAGGAMFANIPATVPAGYFELTIQVDRATSMFDVFFDGVNVFTGQGFAGDIEQVVMLSLMEEAGPTFDVDDFEILDGEKTFTKPYITVSPASGDLGAGESVEITVTFNSEDLEFGTYSSDITIDISGGAEQLVVPAILRVFGDPNIEVDPTVLQAEVPYRGDTTQTFEIANTGGNPLTYSLQVIGADTDAAKLPPGPVSKFKISDNRVTDKLRIDNERSHPIAEQHSTLEVLTGTPLLTENFDGASFPPAGWDTKDNENTGVSWFTAAAWGEGNYSGTGEAATASSDAAGPVEFDTELITPSISAAGFKNIAVQFNANYQNFANLDYLDVDIQVAGSSTWTNILRWNEDHGSFRNKPGQFVTLSLDAYIGSAPSFKLRWHYYDPNTDDWDWYAQIDDVVILGDARTWLAVSPASGTVPVRGSSTITASFDAMDLDPGFYVAGILVNNNSVEHPLVGVVASLDVMGPAAIQVAPEELTQELWLGETATQTLTVSNTGESPLHFSFEGIATAGPSAVKQERIVTTDGRTSPSPVILKLDDTNSIAPSVSQLAGVELYATGFEEFTTGNINGQLGWIGQFGNWTVETVNPSGGAQHFRGLSDGLGQSLAFSPKVAFGTDPISSTVMDIDLSAPGVTWQIIPQSPAAGKVNTRFMINPDGSMMALVADSLGAASWASVPGAWPSGYTELRIDVVRATSVFTMYIGSVPVFTGQGFAGNIEQIVMLSLMEDAGPTFDVDNFAILDGTPSAPWLQVSPLSGTVPGGGSASITVFFDARDQEAGVYTDTLNIASNDPATPWANVPVTLTVMQNLPPVISPFSDVTVLEKQIMNVTFTATDADDSVVNVSLLGLPGFVTLLSQSNGTATYKINPGLGAEGEYDLLVQAEDGRGAMDIDTFHISVIKFAVVSFSLVNSTTGEVVAEFEDAITINRALPGFSNLNIRANATPSTVGSVKFKLNGSQKNIDNTNPYMLKTGLLAGLGIGDYTLFAEPFTETGGHGQRGVNKQAVVSIVNFTTVVTDFSLVNTSTGEVLLNFDDSVTVDSSDPDFANLNIRANTYPATVGSVKFKIDGTQRNIDNTNPYLLKSQALQLLSLGHHTLLAEPFTESGGHGTRGQSNNASINVISSAAARQRNEETDLFGSDSKTSFTIHPVPVKDHLEVTVSGKLEGDVEVSIINIRGQVVYKARISAEASRRYRINAHEIGLSTGMYYMVLQNVRLRDTKKFLKE
ncbi:MAG: S8 family serine peptidase [Bacteroidota bacterium]